jgi:hypothetical protein
MPPVPPLTQRLADSPVMRVLHREWALLGLDPVQEAQKLDALDGAVGPTDQLNGPPVDLCNEALRLAELRMAALERQPKESGRLKVIGSAPDDMTQPAPQ